MTWSNRALAVALIAGAIFAGTAAAGIPDPGLSVVPNVVMSPTGDLEYVVTVNSSQGPLADSIVQIVFSSEVDAIVCWCAGQAHPVVTATTDAAGQARFFIGAGGCIDPGLVATPPAVSVYADGIKLREVGAVGPDAVDNAGLLPAQGWNPGTTCEVGLSDAALHSPPVKSGAYSFCSDMNSDLQVDLSDAVVLSAAIKGGATCSQ
jgi:hypothetical protein